MRWLHYNRQNPAETAERERVIRRIDAWWHEFARSTDRLEQLFQQVDRWDLPGWMERHLQAIHPELMWEFGPGVATGRHRLVITPETHAELRPLVEDIVARAPRISGWEFYTYRLAEKQEHAASTVIARTGVKLDGVTVAAAIGEANRIDLVYRWEQFPHDRESAFDAAFVATESLLGERSLDRWVGMINAVDDLTPKETGQRFLPLSRLQPTFSSLVDSAKAQLPAEPFAARIEDAQWAVLKLKPQEARDYADRDDLLTSMTCDADLVAATFSEAPFYSERFSRCDETFCYLKVDGADAAEMDFQDREDMEEAVRIALESQELGCLIGAGTGLRYTYAELALTDVKRGIAAVSRAMREGNVSRRSWIHFHDADLAAEWVGIYEDSPTPPQRTAQ